MESLIIESRERINKVSDLFTRYLYNRINWKNRLIAIKGSRGVGKTTLLLQHLKKELPQDHTVLYVPLDHLYFFSNKLIELADQFVMNDGKYLFLDEIHKYSGWSREIKLIYDKHTELQIVFTSSSILEIYKGESDLSRRAVSYNLNELSLREFIELESGVKLPSYTLDDIIHNHVNISSIIVKEVKPLFEYGKYIRYGAYPFFMEGIEEYSNKLINTINMILENDLPAVHKIDFKLISKLKKLLFAISTSVPFKPNISKLSIKTEVTRPTLILFLSYLEKALLIYQLHAKNIGITAMNKPEKIYLHNTNLLFHLAINNTNVGNIRETFFLNQLSGENPITYSNAADFFVDYEYTFEIGGKNKDQKQIQNLNKAFVVKDNIETGIQNIIPLWLFGFLY